MEGRGVCSLEVAILFSYIESLAAAPCWSERGILFMVRGYFNFGLKPAFWTWWFQKIPGVSQRDWTKYFQKFKQYNLTLYNNSSNSAPPNKCQHVSPTTKVRTNMLGWISNSQHQVQKQHLAEQFCGIFNTYHGTCACEPTGMMHVAYCIQLTGMQPWHVLGHN